MSEKARLSRVNKDGSREEFDLSTQVTVVGRDASADICLDEPLMSRMHARIEKRGEKYFVLDLGSTNLTRVNGEVVLERELHHGDEVGFARARLTFLCEGTDPVARGV